MSIAISQNLIKFNINAISIESNFFLRSLQSNKHKYKKMCNLINKNEALVLNVRKDLRLIHHYTNPNNSISQRSSEQLYFTNQAQELNHTDSDSEVSSLTVSAEPPIVGEISSTINKRGIITHFRELWLSVLDFSGKNRSTKEHNNLFYFENSFLPKENGDAKFIKLVNHSQIPEVTKNIKDFQSKIDDVSSTTTIDSYLRSIDGCSKNIVETVLKTIFCAEGYPGLASVRTGLQKIMSEGGNHPEEIHKLYNIIIYATPFALCNQFPYHVISPDLFLCSPYQVVADQLQLFLVEYPFHDLSFTFKMQMRLERSAWTQLNSRELYELSTVYLHYGHRTGTLAVVPGMSDYFINPISIWPTKVFTYVGPPTNLIGLGLKIPNQEKSYKDLEQLAALVSEQ